MSTIRLKHWVGGLGNNLEQIAFAYWLAESTNGQLICDVKHQILSVPKIIRFGNKLEPIVNGCFSGNYFLKKNIDTKNKRFENLHVRLQKIAPQLFKNIPIKKFNGLVVHVRAGNIYKNISCGKYMIQAPINFFEEINKKLKFKKDILILTNPKCGKDPKNYHNPTTQAIKNYCNKNNLKCYIHQGKVEEAISYLLHAKHAIITGYTTFSRFILLSNTNLKTVVIPVMSNWPHDEISFNHHPCKTHYFDIKNYLKKWSCKHVKKQINHLSKNIIYRG